MVVLSIVYHRRVQRLLLAVSLLFAGACSDDGVSLLIELRTDLTPGVEFDAVLTEVEGGARSEVVALPDRDFLAGYRVASFDGLTAGQSSLRLRLVREDGTEVATRRVVVEHESTTGVTVVVTRSCLSITCPASGGPTDATSCLAGQCVVPECVDGTQSSCPADLGCASDGECAAPTAACASAACLGGVCFARGDDGMCAADEYCRPETGCAPADGSPIDAAMDSDALDAGPDGDADAGALVPVTLPRSISGGYWHTCALRSGEVRCWGFGSSGRLGNGDTMSSASPVSVVGLTDATHVSGYSHTCAIRASGAIVCWGGNATGALGDGTTMEKTTPVAVVGIDDAVDVATGPGHTCAIRASGQLLCWGQDQFSSEVRTTPVVIPEIPNATDVALGQSLGCAALRTGQVHCWGNNSSGQLGDGTTTGRSEPAPVLGISDAVSVGVGFYLACALLSTGEVACWGDGEVGTLGDGRGVSSPTPVMVSGLDDAVQLTVGYFNACALRRTGQVVCWGDTTGDGTWMPRLTPVPVGLADVVEIEVGAYHGCALHGSGAMSCWGLNDDGQLGDGTTTASPSPVAVVGL
jgi:alpha-tubulin suppressor-like RCC1 family protein